MKRVLLVFAALALAGCTATPPSKAGQAPSCTDGCDPTELVHRFYQARANHDDAAAKALMSPQLLQTMGAIALAPAADYELSGYGVGGAANDPDSFVVDVAVLTLDAAHKSFQAQSYQERLKVDPTCHCRIVELSRSGPAKTLYQGTLLDPLTLPKPANLPQKPADAATSGCQAEKMLSYFYHARALQSEEGAMEYLSADLRKQSQGTKWAINPRKNSPFTAYSIHAAGQGLYEVQMNWAVVDPGTLYVYEAVEEVRVGSDGGAGCKITDLRQKSSAVVYKGRTQ